MAGASETSDGLTQIDITIKASSVETDPTATSLAALLAKLTSEQTADTEYFANVDTNSIQTSVDTSAAAQASFAEASGAGSSSSDESDSIVGRLGVGLQPEEDEINDILP